MVDSEYCTRADIANVLQGGTLRSPARLVAEVQPATDLVVLDGHMLALDGELVFRAEAGGSMPAPLVAGVKYFAIPISDSTFQIAATPGGPAIDLTTAGDLLLVTAPLPWTAAIQWASGIVEQALGAHRTQLVGPPYPELVATATATLAAWRLLQFTGQTQLSLKDVVLDAHKLIDTWAKGIPLRGPAVPPSANLAVTATSSPAPADPRGYAPPDGTIP